MKNWTSDDKARYISLGLFVALILFVMGFHFWSNRHGAAIGRLSELRESAKRKASRMADSMRGCELKLPPSAERENSQPRNTPLPGRCLIIDRSLPDGDSLEVDRYAISIYNAWLADEWRAERPEDIAAVIWLQSPRNDFGPDTIYLRDGKVVGTSGSKWDENYRAMIRVTVTDRNGHKLREFQVAGQARNGSIADLRSFEASIMRHVAEGLGNDIWSPKFVAQFESPRYESPK